MSDADDRGPVDRDVMPCEAQCPKCGSRQTRLKWVPKGGVVHNEDYGKCRNRYASGQAHFYEAFREHLDHTCDRCAYRWQTLIPARRRKPAGHNAPFSGERSESAGTGG